VPAQVALKSRIPEIIGQLPARAKGLEMTLAQETADAAQSRAPVATGNLKNSIEARSVPSGAAVYAAFYWFLVEFGTANQPANPYMTPAYEQAYASIWEVGRREFAGL
jgi:HK97 gp10 family phage protein